MNPLADAKAIKSDRRPHRIKMCSIFYVFGKPLVWPKKKVEVQGMAAFQ